MKPSPSGMSSDQMWVVVAPEDAQASIEAAYRDLDCAPALVSYAWPRQDLADDQGAVLVKAGPFLLWAFDPYEGARLDRALYGSEVGCRLGDD